MYTLIVAKMHDTSYIDLFGNVTKIRSLCYNGQFSDTYA